MSSFNSVFYCLPGFLGLGQDWLSCLPWYLNLKLYDWFTPSIPTSLHQALQLGLEGVGHWVNQSISESQGKLKREKRVLVGYSLGGRIGLHALLESPGFWEAAVIVSAHPGMTSDLHSQERKLRLESDQHWAERWLHDPWEQVLLDWNNQTVFLGGTDLLHRSLDRSLGKGLARRLENFSRDHLALALKSCSLAKQQDLRPRLMELNLPILWISGERDVKFRSLLEPLKELNPKFSVATVPEAGHRVPWDQPRRFSNLLTDWVKKLGS